MNRKSIFEIYTTNQLLDVMSCAGHRGTIIRPTKSEIVKKKLKEIHNKMTQRKKQIREDFRNSVFGRDGYKCVICECAKDLDAHHITDRKEMPNGGYVKENGITLCPEHHWKAETFHITGGKKWEENFHPDDLYKLISSNKEDAIIASLKL